MTFLRPQWTLPPANLNLSDQDIHLWKTNLNVSKDTLSYLNTLLSKDEQERAQRFRFERDRSHFIAGRGTLRCILGRYLNCDPDQICFSYSPKGKPSLEAYAAAPQFSLSHSHGLALYGLTRDRAIGVDLEYYRPIGVESLAKSFFSAREFTLLQSLPAEQQLATFFHLWTCKEAYL